MDLLPNLLPRAVEVFFAWCGGLALIAGAVAALCLMVKYTMHSAKALTTVNDLVPVMLAMADQFKNNGGSTLKDAIDKIAESISEISLLAKRAETVAQEARETAKQAKITSEEVSAQLTHMLENIPEGQGRILQTIHDHAVNTERVIETAAKVAAQVAKGVEP